MASETVYGFKYSSSSLPCIKDIDVNKIRYVRIQWSDLINQTHCRVVPLSHFMKILESPRHSITLAKCLVALVFGTIAPVFSAAGEYLFVLDLTTLRPCPWAPNTMAITGWFEEKIPVPDPMGDLTLKVLFCPRTLLKRIVDAAQTKLNVSFLAGFETEFILLKDTRPIIPANTKAYSLTSALLAGDKETEALEEMAEAVMASKIELQMYHAELAPGQYEIITGPLPPLEAADALVHTREIIYNIANKHGFRATLAPRVFENSCGSASHVHISVHSSTPFTTNLSPHETWFLSGLLEHLPAIAALTLPLDASYSRVADGVWSGGTYVCWGTDNRETPVRLCNATGFSRNFEVKCIDGTASPYLALAGILAAGVVGIKERKPLTLKDCDGETTAANMTEEERRAAGIDRRLPLNLADAISNLKGDEVLCKALGEEFVEAYVSANKMVSDYMKKDGPLGSLSDLVETY